MKNSVYFLTCIVLSGCLLLSLNSFAEDADKESVENQDQDAFFSNIPFPKNLYTEQRFKKLPEDIYIDPKTCREIILKPFYKEKNGVLEEKTSHEYSSYVVQVFNLHLMQEILTKKLESGDEVVLVPAGTVILKEEISYLEMAKNVSLALVGFATLIWIYTLFSNNNNSQQANNSSQNHNSGIDNKN